MPPAPSLAGIYLVFTLSLGIGSMLVAVLLLNLDTKDEPVPGWVRRVVLDGIGRLVCVRDSSAGSCEAG